MVDGYQHVERRNKYSCEASERVPHFTDTTAALREERAPTIKLVLQVSDEGRLDSQVNRGRGSLGIIPHGPSVL